MNASALSKNRIVNKLESLNKQISKKEEDLKTLKVERAQFTKHCPHPKKHSSGNRLVGTLCKLCGHTELGICC
jgi:DNA repair exonuclease SbcCD ATPase subunit